jgi:uncharacterized circularly permuted ATP-grasp superfamily protein/uncharacterized alpha-E superfamily protein
MQETHSLSGSLNTLDKLGCHYKGIDGLFDEMSVKDNQIRPHWEYLIQSLKTLGTRELELRVQEAQRLLRDNGVTYNVFGDPQKRDRTWQLDPIPLLISSEEWATIERGLAQRAELMNLLAADLYGPRQTLQQGLLPLELVANYPGFLRPCHGINFSKHHHLLLYAVDLIRSPDGCFWAIADRTQAPAGAGYALENRLVMSRILPSLFRDSHVHRLALFFRTLRTTLAQLSGNQDHRIVLLSSGPEDETYFEHAYLAKYLGYTLVQGADLTVREGKVRLRTLDGLQPVDVILRRVDDLLCDPLELEPNSCLGVAGLMQAVRMRNVAMANPLGIGVLENPGLLAFINPLARYFLGEDLLIPSPTTWWCGQTQACDYVLTHLEKLVIKSIQPGKVAIHGQFLNEHQREQLRQQIRAKPQWFVGIEEPPRSTAPIFTAGHLEPRQVILRSFLVSCDNHYQVMPGGLTRVSANSDSLYTVGQSENLTKDTWVLAAEPVVQLTLLPTVQPIVRFEGQRELPSRVAENLFWLGRYAERAEGTIRLLRTVSFYLSEFYDFKTPQHDACLQTLLKAVTYLTQTYPGFVGEGAEVALAMPEKELLSVFLDKNRFGSLSSTLQSLLNAARSVRDRISLDLWHVISDIDEQLQSLQQSTGLRIDDLLDELDNLIHALAAFAGFSIENITHEMGWHFLLIGRRLERATQSTYLLQALLTVAIADDSVLLEYLLVITDSLLTYRRRYRSQAQVNAALELVLQSESNPRSIGYQLESLHRHIRELPRHDVPYHSAEERLILEALTQLRLADVDQLAQVGDNYLRPTLNRLLLKIGQNLADLSNALTNSYFSHAEQPHQLVRLGTEVEI